MAKKDNKASYARLRCIEEMYKDEPAGLFNYGYIEDLEKINSKTLYEYYQNLLKECKIDIFVSGKVDISDQFFAWVCGFGKRMVIETPEIAEQYKTHLEKILEKY